MAQISSERFVQMEAMSERLVRTSARLVEASDNFVKTQQAREVRLQKLENGLLGLTEMAGIMLKETQQLKRTMDYLLSQDGERGSGA